MFSAKYRVTTVNAQKGIVKLTPTIGTKLKQPLRLALMIGAVLYVADLLNDETTVEDTFDNAVDQALKLVDEK